MQPLTICYFVVCFSKLKSKVRLGVWLVLLLTSDLCVWLTSPQIAASYLLDCQSGMSVSPRVPAQDVKEYASSAISIF